MHHTAQTAPHAAQGGTAASDPVVVEPTEVTGLFDKALAPFLGKRVALNGD